MIAGIKPQAPTWLVGWNSDVTGALDKLFLQGVAGVVPYYHCSLAVATLTQYSWGGSHTEALHVTFPWGHFFAPSKYLFLL